MLRLRALVLERDERAVLRELGGLGIMQLIRAPASGDTAAFAARDRTAELARCEALLARVHELRRSLEAELEAEVEAELEVEAEVEATSPDAASLRAASADAASLKAASPDAAPAAALELRSLERAGETLRALEEQTSRLLTRRQALLAQRAASSAAGEKVSRYGGLGLPLRAPERYAFLHVVTGTLPAEALDPLRLQVGEAVALLPLLEREGRQALIAMSTRAGWPALEGALLGAGFQREILPAIEGATAETFSEENRREQQQVAAELERLGAEARALASRCAPVLARIASLAGTERCLLQAEQSALGSEAAVLLEGWVPAEDARALERRLRELARGRCVVETASSGEAATPEAQVPVLLRHPRWLRPFEALVAAYGLPTYGELEPTLFVALSYLVMFGMMFGDAGHGALLVLGGLLARRRGRTPTIRQVGTLLCYGGCSSAIFGVLYGSYFGVEQLKRHALWSDPLAGDPLRFMLAAIGVGVVLISLGLILNVVNCLRRRDWIGGVLGQFGLIGLLFYWGALALVTGVAPPRSPALLVVVLLVPLAGWCLREPLALVLERRAGHPAAPGGGVLAAITESSVGAFEAVLSYLANTISFVRLAAYAMSHAALLTAAFAMADQLRHVSVGGGALSVLVIVLGNAVAIVLEGIVAAVQTVRLEYYEFFGKFFSGNGQPFTPFRLVTGVGQRGAR